MSDKLNDILEEAVAALWSEKNNETNLSVQAGMNQRNDDEIAVIVDGLLQQIESLKKQLAAYTQRADARVSGLIDLIRGGLQDESNAFQAHIIYSPEWFSNLPYSVDAKKNIAETLINETSKFDPSWVSPLWVGIVSNDPSSTELVQYKFSVLDESEVAADPEDSTEGE